MRAFIWILLVLIATCCGCAAVSFVEQLRNPCPVDYRDDRYAQTGRDITRYVVPAEMGRSPLGVPIGPGVDGKAVDAAFTDVAACLHVPFATCGVHAVMIAPDASTAAGAPQAFPCKAFTGLCTGANQWPATIILTPDHHALRWEVERMLLKDDPNNDGGKRCWQQGG